MVDTQKARELRATIAAGIGPDVRHNVLAGHACAICAAHDALDALVAALDEKEHELANVTHGRDLARRDTENERRLLAAAEARADRLEQALREAGSVVADVLMRGENDGGYNAHVIQTAIERIDAALSGLTADKDTTTT